MKKLHIIAVALALSAFAIDCALHRNNWALFDACLAAANLWFYMRPNGTQD